MCPLQTNEVDKPVAIFFKNNRAQTKGVMNES